MRVRNVDADAATAASHRLAAGHQPAASQEAPAGGAGTRAQILWLQRTAGNQAVTRRLAGAPAAARSPRLAVARLVAAPDAEAAFNPGSIVHDLRRAIDQSDISEDWKGSGMSMRPTTRKVDADLVMRVLDGLSENQIKQVEALYQGQEGSSLRNDLFEGGQSDAPSNLKPDKRTRIAALLRGTAVAQGEKTPDSRLEAIAAELHELLASDELSEAKRERLMALYRRPDDDIKGIEENYDRLYGHKPIQDVAPRLNKLHWERFLKLRQQDRAGADALAIEEKRRALAALEKPAEGGMYGDIATHKYNKQREKLIDGITAITDQNRLEALADPANAEKTADEAMNERLRAIMNTPSESGGTLGGELATVLQGTSAARLVVEMTDGSIPKVAAQRLVEMEARDTTRSVKIAELIRGLRDAAERDIAAGLPALPQSDKDALLADPIGKKKQLVSAQAGKYINAFITSYDLELRPPDGRSWATIVAGADSENKEMLNALVEGGGEMAPVDELRFAIRKKDGGKIAAVLRGQRTAERVKALEDAYEAKFKTPVREAIFGALGAEAAMRPGISTSSVRGRDAALIDEALQTPGEKELGSQSEVDWIAKGGAREVSVTEDNSGWTGALREIGDDPETQVLMHESASQLKNLQEAWKAASGNPRLQQTILAEMKKVRATLTGDAAAYEAENAEIRAKIRSAVSMAVQIAMALALPGIGTGLAGFIATTAMNIGVTVASNAIIYGEEYSLSMFYDDVVGGGLGALGGKLGEDFAKLATGQIVGKTAEGVGKIAADAGKVTRLGQEAGAAAAMAKEASFGIKALVETGNIAGSTAATSLATGQDGFTFDALLQSFLMNRLGGLKGEGGAAPGGEQARPAAEAPPHAAGESHAPAAAGEAPAPRAGEPPAARPDAAPVADAPPKPLQEAAAHAPQQEGAVPASERAQAGEPAHPGAETAPVAGEGRPAEAAGSGGGAAAGGRSRASERLEARAMVRSMEQLASQWPGMGEPARRAALSDIANQVLAVRDVPSIKVETGPAGAGNDANFDYKTWTITIDPAMINEPSLPPKLVAAMSDLARHESEHVLQWWSMAKLRASQGSDAKTIAAEMYGIPVDVAEHAVRTVEQQGMSTAEQSAAQVWWDSIYSPTTTRDANLDLRKTHREELAKLDAEVKEARDRGEKPDRELLHKRDELREVVAGFDEIYKNLPEERVAYEKGGATAQEAALMELELQVDLAEVAVKHAADDVRAIEDTYLAGIASGGKPDPAVAARHGQQIEKLKALHEQADALRTQRDTAAEAINARDQQPEAAAAPAAAAAGQAGAGAAQAPAPAARSEAPRMAAGSAGGRRPPGEPPGPGAPKRNPVVEERLTRIKSRLAKRGLDVTDLGLGVSSFRELGDHLARMPHPEQMLDALDAMSHQAAREIDPHLDVEQSRAELESRGAPSEATDPFGGEARPTYNDRPEALPDGSIDRTATEAWMKEHGLDKPLEIDEIHYRPLDELGRAQGIVAELRPGELVGGSSAYHDPHGYEGKRKNHAQGHLLGKQLGGAGADPRNIALLYQVGANTPDMSRLEGKIRRAVDRGETVTYEVTVVYDGDNPLPMGVRLTAKGDDGFHLTADVYNVSRPPKPKKKKGQAPVPVAPASEPEE